MCSFIAFLTDLLFIALYMCSFIAFVIALLLYLCVALLQLLPLLFPNPMIYSVNKVQICVMSNELS